MSLIKLIDVNKTCNNGYYKTQYIIILYVISFTVKVDQTEHGDVNIFNDVCIFMR